jgi:hypothetical protein
VCSPDECGICKKQTEHVASYTRARQEYKAEQSKRHDDHQVYSADMQKIMMLPRMPGVKTAVFTRRIIAFHETFAPVGKGSTRPPLGTIWHEGVGGRQGEEVASTFIAAMRHPELRDCKALTLWCDNCTGQQKKLHFIHGHQQ